MSKTPTDEPAELVEWRELIADLAGLLDERDAVVAVGDEDIRAGLARDHLLHAISFVRSICGPEVLRSAYGRLAGDGRRDLLNAIAGRISLASWLFLDVEDGDRAGLQSVLGETRAILGGDNPQLFARLPVTPGKYLKAHRVMLKRAEALYWDRYLKGLGIGTGERRAAICQAFSAEWDTISKRWKDELISAWGGHAVGQRLASEERDARRGLRRWFMKPGEPWKDALLRSGLEYRSSARSHAEAQARK